MLGISASTYIPMEGSYDPFLVEKFSLIVEIIYGKGKSIYISGDIGDTITNYGLNDLKKILQYLLRDNIDSAIKVENAYETVEIELREQQSNRKLLHFVNYTGCMQRPIDYIIPCRDVKVFLRTSDKVVSVYMAWNGNYIDFKTCSGGIEFLVPVIYEYELVVVNTD